LKEVISSSPFLNGLASFLRRLVMLHSQELVLITIVSIAVSPVNFSHFLLILLLLVKFPFRSGTSGVISVVMVVYLGVWFTFWPFELCSPSSLPLSSFGISDPA
jgi:hypothetical protein